eukprot:RCo043881
MPPAATEKPGEEAAGGQLTDKRMQWLEQRIMTCLRLKHAEMKKFIENEDVRVVFLDFLDTIETRRMFVVAPPGQPVAVSLEPPESLKKAKKAIFFIKRGKGREKITPEAIASQISVGELGASPLETLSLLTKEAFLPFVQNHMSMPGLSPLLQKELEERFHALVGQLDVTIGLTKGRTVLPLPTVDPGIPLSSSMAAKDLKYALEATIAGWTKQIQTVLRQDPELMLQDKSHPGPLKELEFWATRIEDLQSLGEQLRGPEITKILEVLEQIQISLDLAREKAQAVSRARDDAPHLSSGPSLLGHGADEPRSASKCYLLFPRLVDEVQFACSEAASNLRYLSPLKPLFEALCPATSSKQQYEEMMTGGLFRRIFHCIYLVWTNSRHYNVPSRVVVLIREICNDLIAHSRLVLNVEDILTIDPEDAIGKLSTVLFVCGHFKSVYFHYKSKVSAEAKNPWKFQNVALFSRLDSFLERCHDVLDMLETTVLFSRLDKVEIGGTKGKELTATVQEVLREFQEEFESFRHVKFDILNVDTSEFDQNFQHFRSVVRDLERRLGSVLFQAFDDAATIYSA